MWVLRVLFPAGNASEQREQIHQIFNNLRAQIPLLYAACFVNLVGMHAAIGGEELTLLSPVTIMSVLLIWRAAYWAFFQRPSENHEIIRAELVKVAFFTALFCAGFSVWAQVLMTRYPELALNIAMFNLLAALGASYGLSSFPSAALLPLIILGLPVAARLLFWDDNLTAAMGISLLLAILLFMRLLRTHSRALASLMESRMAASREHNRAISAEAAALKRADEDGLTGLPNRSKLIREIDIHMVRGPGSGGGSVVAICDLDGFKRANDVFGHAAGDAVLTAFGQRLAAAFEGEAIVARMGGDEFAIFWRAGLAREAISSAGELICELATRPVAWMGKNLAVATSCGFSEAGPHTAGTREFLRQADTALYMAKASGRGRWQFYDESAHSIDMRRAKLEMLLLNEGTINELTVQYQPIYSMQDNGVAYIEALARWKSAELGQIHPGEFISLAESLGRIEPVNDAILEKALMQIGDWRPDIRLSFNLSAAQISRRGATAHLLRMLKGYGIPPERLLFEIRESALPADLCVAKHELERLRGAGCLTALDDFGAGHASVSYLRDLEFDVVKLDGSLTEKIAFCARSRQILLGLVNLCHAAGALCVAEHIETHEQLTLVKAMGCDMAQGFYLSQPMEAGQLVELAIAQAL